MAAPITPYGPQGSGLTAPAHAPPAQTYIQDLRNCSTKEQEKERVDKELGKIRKKYTSDKGLTGAAAAAAAARGAGQAGSVDRLQPLVAAQSKLALTALPVQTMTSASTCGSCCTLGCWGTRWTLGTSRPWTL